MIGKNKITRAYCDNKPNILFCLYYEGIIDASNMKNKYVKSQFLPFLFPNGMSMNDGFKVLSYLIDYMYEYYGIEVGSYKSISVLDKLINLECLGFRRCNLEENVDVLNLCVTNQRIPLFRFSDVNFKITDWYSYGVSELEVIKIYEKCGLSFKKMSLLNLATSDNNLLLNIIDDKMILYKLSYGEETIYFENLDDLGFYRRMKLNNDYSFSVISYVGKVDGKIDVIKITDNYGQDSYCTYFDDDGYLCYNFEKSLSEGKSVWEYKIGSLKKIYDVFMKKGIIFENLMYGKDLLDVSSSLSRRKYRNRRYKND